jgi:hypothetical protein
MGADECEDRPPAFEPSSPLAQPIATVSGQLKVHCSYHPGQLGTTSDADKDR